MGTPYIQYGLSQYGLYPYGKYELETSEFKILSNPRMRIRLRNESYIGLWLETYKERIALNSYLPKIRIKSNLSEWVYTGQVYLDNNKSKVRIRSINEIGDISPWVIYEQGTLKEGGN